MECGRKDIYTPPKFIYLLAPVFNTHFILGTANFPQIHCDSFLALDLLIKNCLFAYFLESSAQASSSWHCPPPSFLLLRSSCEVANKGLLQSRLTHSVSQGTAEPANSKEDLCLMNGFCSGCLSVQHGMPGLCTTLLCVKIDIYFPH